VKHFPRIAFVIVLVSSLVIAQSNVLFAQSALPNSAQTTLAPLTAMAQPALPPAGSNRLSMPALKPPQASSTKKWGVAVGLAMAGTGAVLLARNEGAHQTTCVPYGACPRPGIVKITGGTMVGIGIPLTILKLRGR
jgi:hypothetical protein